MEQHFTTTAAAKMLHVDPLTVGKWVDRGYLRAYRTAGGHRRILAADLLRYLVEHGMPIPPELGNANKKLKLLVVDDEQPALNAISRSFRPLKETIEVTTTTSGVKAMILLSDTRPDAMLIDINMPDLDGFEVCRQARDYEPLSKVTLILMSAFLRPSQAAQATKAGAVACLEKPIDVNQLVALVRDAQTAAAHGTAGK